MTINIVCTSKPVDGLLFYSYEYCSYLNKFGISANLVIICHRNFTKHDYVSAINTKYIHCDNVIFDEFTPTGTDVTLVMGRSMITLSWQNFRDYSLAQQDTLKSVFSGKVIAVYSENHPREYPIALDFYKILHIVDICDTDIYPNGQGIHFEKRINFSIYKPFTDAVRFKYLFLGTNDKYYASAMKVIDQYADHGILTYNSTYINKKYNNVFVPVENLIGIFDTYVYTKETSDPAPRIFQECKYFEKHVIYQRSSSIVDGGSVYWKRRIKEIDLEPILTAYEKLHKT